MKTSTIIRLSIFFFIAAFLCALVLKKITTSSTPTEVTSNDQQVSSSAVPTEPQKQITASKVSQENTFSNDQIEKTEPRVEIKKEREVNIENEIDATPTPSKKLVSKPLPQNNFSPKLTNSWDPRKQSEYLTKVKTALSKLSLNSNEQSGLLTLITKESELANVNPLLSFILIKKSSGFQKDLIRGEKIGLLQVSDAEAQQISNSKNFNYLGKVTLTHPKVNTRLGLARFRLILEQNNFNLRSALIEFSETTTPDSYIQQIINEIKNSF